MAAAPYRSPLKKIAPIVAAGVVYGLYKLNARSLFISTFTDPGSTSRIIAAILIVANFKNFPFVWHYRVWKAIVQQFEVSRRSYTPEAGPAAIFQPVITSSISPLAECDYNLHKSNSTYFSDLDVSRSHLFGALFCEATKKLQNQKNLIYVDGKPHNGRFSIALGAVHCSFKKEIKPYETYEMWTRVLAWDRKWLYIVTHFVKKGAVKPDGYTQEDGSVIKRLLGKKKKPSAEEIANGAKDPVQSAIFATAVSKYVVKLGRLTVNPETCLVHSNLLPPRPGGWADMSATSDISASSTFEKLDTEHSTDGKEGDKDEWTWQRIVAENERGLEFANHFAALDALHGEFSGEDSPALGVYTDFLF